MSARSASPLSPPRASRLVLGALVVTLLGLGLGLGRDARATIVRPFSLAELCRSAHSVVRGEVVDQEVVWDPAWHEVYTLSWLRVDEVLGGREAVGDLVVVRQIGGVLDGVERRVVGTAALAVGDEVVVFARTDGTFHYLVGMAQGAFHVARPAGVPARIQRGPQPSLSADPSADPTGAPLRPLAPDDGHWSALRAEIVRLLGEVTP